MIKLLDTHFKGKNYVNDYTHFKGKNYVNDYIQILIFCVQNIKIIHKI